jgi:hypothetical protein
MQHPLPPVTWNSCWSCYKYSGLFYTVTAAGNKLCCARCCIDTFGCVPGYDKTDTPVPIPDDAPAYSGPPKQPPKKKTKLPVKNEIVVYLRNRARELKTTIKGLNPSQTKEYYSLMGALAETEDTLAYITGKKENGGKLCPSTPESSSHSTKQSPS